MAVLGDLGEAIAKHRAQEFHHFCLTPGPSP